MRRLARVAARRRPFAGSRVWTVVWALGLALRLLRKVAGHEPEVVLSEPLARGQTLVISHDREATVVRSPRATKAP